MNRSIVGYIIRFVNHENYLEDYPIDELHRYQIHCQICKRQIIGKISKFVNRQLSG